MAANYNWASVPVQPKPAGIAPIPVSEPARTGPAPAASQPYSGAPLAPGGVPGPAPTPTKAWAWDAAAGKFSPDAPLTAGGVGSRPAAATAATLGQAAQARAETLGSTPQAQAQFAAAPTQAETQYAQAVLAANPWMADQRDAIFSAALDPTRAAVQQYQAQQVAGQSVLHAGRYDPVLAQQVQIEQAQQAAARERLMGLAGQYQAGIDGTAPSAAEALFRKNAEAAANQQLGLAASAARGGNTALALRRAGMNIGQLQAQAANDAAILRAQEVAQNRNALAGLLTGVRASDIGLATSQAQLAQQTQLANAAAFNAAGQFNTGQANDMLRLQAQLGAQKEMFNVGALNAANQFNAGQFNDTERQYAALQNATNLQNSSLYNQMQQFNAGQYNENQRQFAALSNAQNIANAGFQNSANQFNAGAANQSAQQYAGLQSAWNISNAQIANQANQFNTNLAAEQAARQAQLNQQTALANLAAQNQFALANAGFQQQANLANYQGGISMRGQDIQRELGMRAGDQQGGNNAAAWGAIGGIGGGIAGAFLGNPMAGFAVGSAVGSGLGSQDSGSFGWW